jgi:hypothetical protein
MAIMSYADNRHNMRMIIGGNLEIIWEEVFVIL